MGECGCSAEAVGKMPLPDGTTLVVEIYPGCEYCGADWALSLAHFKNDDPELKWWHDDTPVIAFDQMGYWHRTILDADRLRASFKKYADKPDDEFDPVNYAMTEFIERGDLRDAFPFNHQSPVTTIRELSEEEQEENTADDHCELCGEYESECICDGAPVTSPSPADPSSALPQE